MSSKQATPLAGVLIMGGFIVIGMTVLFTIRASLASSDHSSHDAHHAPWANSHSDSHSESHGTEASTEHPIVTSYESTPRPGVKVRTLEQFYSRRAYPGAPPVIAHPVTNDGVINDDCLSCHKDGGYVPEYNAYAAVTPHPEMGNCRQCHVPQTVENGFVQTEWTMPELPKRGRQAISGGPLQIPHSLHMRDNCLACHAGPQAVVEIKTSHPERKNCVQCHVPDRDIQPFQSIIDPRLKVSDVKK